MARLFVAIPLPEPVIAAITGFQPALAAIPTARPVKAPQMHLTLRFIGADVPEAQIEPIRMALNGVQSAPFPLALSGVGRFPPSPKKALRVLWLGITPQRALVDLHRQVEAALATIGFKPEQHPYNPHITLARLKTHKPTPQADAFLQTNRQFGAGQFMVTQFILYNSTLTPQGPRYVHQAVYVLAET